MQQQLWEKFFQQQEQLTKVAELSTALLQQPNALPTTAYWELAQWLQANQLLPKIANTLEELLPQLLSCQELQWRKSELQQLPTAIGLLWGLITIDAAHNQLQTLPISIGQLPLLQQLHLSHNQLTTVPESLGQLSLLQVLDVSYNNLEELPDSIAWLQQLKTLNLAHNNLTAIPPDCAWLAQLQVLQLSNNLLVDLPDFIIQWPRSLQLDLRNNPLSPTALDACAALPSFITLLL